MYIGILATAEDVGTFLMALDTGTLLSEPEQQIYSSNCVYNHMGLVPGYQSIARYHKELDTVVVQFTNITNFKGDHWARSEVIYDRIVEIISREKQRKN